MLPTSMTSGCCIAGGVLSQGNRIVPLLWRNFEMNPSSPSFSLVENNWASSSNKQKENGLMGHFLQCGNFGCFLPLSPCDQFWWDSPILPIVSSSTYIGHAQNTLVGPVGPFESTLILAVFTPNRWFWAIFTVWIEPLLNSSVLVLAISTIVIMICCYSAGLHFHIPWRDRLESRLLWYFETRLQEHFVSGTLRRLLLSNWVSKGAVALFAWSPASPLPN